MAIRSSDGNWALWNQRCVSHTFFSSRNKVFSIWLCREFRRSGIDKTRFFQKLCEKRWKSSTLKKTAILFPPWGYGEHKKNLYQSGSSLQILQSKKLDTRIQLGASHNCSWRWMSLTLASSQAPLHQRGKNHLS